ncbi:hypothetical protein K1719_017388 [Acacia pycnantha]|nr:hypothetical protein K1719_017388 [Acacia pycnantha]
MAFSKSSVFFFFFFFLITNVRSEFSFNFPTFDPANVRNLGLIHDAVISDNVLQLTKKDQHGNPLQLSVGQSVFMKPFHLYDKVRGKVADFTTVFSFVVNPQGRSQHGDGMTFFLKSTDLNLPNADESDGGNLGIFNRKTSDTQIVAVEFDTFANEWDPTSFASAHLGIDVNSVVSQVTVGWPTEFVPDGTVAHAFISYDSKTQELSVSVKYPKANGASNGDASLKHIIDLRDFLPERVLIGFSAATGDSVETHDIVSWSFTSSL